MSKKDPKIHIASQDEVAKYGKGPEQPETSSQSERAGEQAGGEGQASTPPEAEQKVSLEQAQAEAQQWKDRFLRAKADYQNLVRRSAKECSEAVRFANADFARSMLAILDDFERTFEAAKTAESIDGVVEGLRIIYEHFLKLLKQHGIEPIEAEHKPFDPFEHEAIAEQVSADQPAGAVLEVKQRGYRMHERVLRPARVVVSAGPAEEQRPAQGAAEADERSEDRPDQTPKPCQADESNQESS